MGFLRTIRYQVRAKKLTTAFREIRESYHPFFIRSIDAEKTIPSPESRNLSDEKPDYILMALQLSIFSNLINAKHYLSDKRISELSGQIVSLCADGKSRSEFHQNLDKLTFYHEQLQSFSILSPEVIANVAMLLHEAIEPDVDPFALVGISRHLLRFSLQTQMMVAQQFNDSQTVRHIEFQFQTLPSIY